MNAARILLLAVPLLLRASVPSDACALLTQAEVSAALGTAVAAGSHIMPQNVVICGWAPAAGPTLGGKEGTVTIMRGDAVINRQGAFPRHGQNARGRIGGQA